MESVASHPTSPMRDIPSPRSSPSSGSAIVCMNYDLLKRILDHLQDGPSSGSHRCNPLSPSAATKKNLLAACLVSKSSFFDPALDTLWCHLDSVYPVLRILPAFQIVYSKWALTGLVNDEDLRRVLFYSRRIRSIRIDSPPDRGLIDALIILSSQLHALQPFPTLTKLILNITPAQNVLDPMLFIMPPTITNVVIKGISFVSQITVSSFLQHVSSVCGSLQQLTIAGDISNTLITVLARCTSLRSLTLKSRKSILSANNLKKLASSLPSLEKLDLKLSIFDPNSNSRPSEFPPISNQYITFNSVRHLTLTADVRIISDMLSLLKAPQLCELTLSFSSLITRNTPQATTFASCMSQLVEINGPEGKGNLQVVKISQSNPSTCLEWGVFDSLEAVKDHLQVLHIQSNQLVWTSATKYKSPLFSTLIYRNLVDLRVTYQPSLQPGPRSYVTAIMLRDVSWGCPSLKKLHISIGGEEWGFLHLFTRFHNPDDMPLHSLQTLVFHHLPEWKRSISLTVGFARYINSLFPMLLTLRYLGKSSSEEVEEWWTGVHDIWKACQGQECGRRTLMQNLSK